MYSFRTSQLTDGRPTNAEFYQQPYNYHSISYLFIQFVIYYHNRTLSVHERVKN